MRATRNRVHLCACALPRSSTGGCRFPVQCPAPVLALYKVLQKDEYKMDGGQVLVKNGQGAILIPHMFSGAHNQADPLAEQQLATVPWTQKRRKVYAQALHHLMAAKNV